MQNLEQQFDNNQEYYDWLEREGKLPHGFRVGATKLSFTPEEFPKEVKMSLSVIALEQPSASFAGMYTQNSFPGAPVIVGRERLKEPSVQALVINTKVSNVGSKTGVDDAEKVCSAAAELVGCERVQVLPFSTGVIGWKLPADAIVSALPQVIQSLQKESVLPAAKGIMTTDLFPKIRHVSLGKGSIVGIAKGAGMIEPNLATMLVFILTDIKIDRDALNQALRAAVKESFNSISIDSDQSTSDSVVALSSNLVEGVEAREFGVALKDLCIQLAKDVVRNGEGVHHVVEVSVSGASSEEMARGVGKSILRSPLVKTALCGNDPNVGRIIMAIGNFVGSSKERVNFESVSIHLGDELIFDKGAFLLSADKEKRVAEYLKSCELYSSSEPDDHGRFAPPLTFPKHQLCVALKVDLGQGHFHTKVWGGDLTHEYISENADYRS